MKKSKSGYKSFSKKFEKSSNVYCIPTLNKNGFVKLKNSLTTFSISHSQRKGENSLNIGDISKIKKQRSYSKIGSTRAKSARYHQSKYSVKSKYYQGEENLNEKYLSNSHNVYK
mmetsp:Transcript_16424/g.14345  ORF Transcript_16424/g.14345 Transcript_16424/m.14345 type:complete len:114 (+) Transcript_16424:298-639(+)